MVRLLVAACRLPLKPRMSFDLKAKVPILLLVAHERPVSSGLIRAHNVKRTVRSLNNEKI